MHKPLSEFYPEREISVTSSDPHYVTPAVKAVLRRKKRLMRMAHVAEAHALAKRIRTAITRSSIARVFSFDFTKAPDTVRHSELMSKLASLQIPDMVYN